MWDPQLAPEQFLRDTVLSRELLFDVDALAGAEGGTRESDSVGFGSPHRLRLVLSPHRTDLSRFNRLTVTALNRTAQPLLVGISLNHGSDDNGPGLPPVSVSGGREVLLPGAWREVSFPAEAFGTDGLPEGWTDVRTIELGFYREKTASESGPVEVSIRCVHGELREIPAGPRLRVPGLSTALGRDVPGVTESLESAAHAPPGPEGSRPGPEQWAPYTASNTGFRIPPPHPYPCEKGEEILEGRVMGQRLHVPVPWDANPSGVLEWAHFLHRHHFLRELLAALVRTGEARFVHAIDEIVASWIASHPVPVGSNGGAGPGWETLSAAWRLREWLWVIGVSWSHPAFRESTKIDMLCSVWEHARSLMDHQGHPGNWIVVESAALALAGMYFPQFREAEKWRKEGLARLGKAFSDQFFSDGVHFEISPLYHAICLHALLEIKEAARVKGIELPGAFDRPLEKCTDYLAALHRPDFSWPSLNDSAGAKGDFTALVGKAGELFRRPDLTWIGSRGLEGRAPRVTSQAFPDAGIAIMRSGHEPDANHLVFRAGPPGAGHVHGDALSLDVTALGIPRLADPGITTYAPDKLTDHYRSPDAHSMILIDGKGPERAGLPFLERIRPAGTDFVYRHDRGLEIATGVCRGPWAGIETDLAVQRTVLFVVPAYWIVRDTVSGEGAHDVTTCWQFLPGRVEIDIRSFILQSIDARGPGFQLIPFTGSHTLEIEQCTGTLHPPRGWVSIDGTDVPGTHVRYSLRGTLPLTMNWVLLPVWGSPRSAVQVSQAAEGTESVSFHIRFP
ncbi:MAG: alginate lyase family protein, partial [Deltaproteobacteria bacterium]